MLVAATASGSIIVELLVSGRGVARIDEARGALCRPGAARRPTFAELFIAFKPVTHFAAAPARKVTDSAGSALPSRRHCLFNRAAVLIKVVDTPPALSAFIMLALSFFRIKRNGDVY